MVYYTFVVSGSIKKLFSIDYVNIYLFSQYFFQQILKSINRSEKRGVTPTSLISWSVNFKWHMKLRFNLKQMVSSSRSDMRIGKTNKENQKKVNCNHSSRRPAISTIPNCQFFVLPQGNLKFSIVSIPFARRRWKLILTACWEGV